MLKLQFVVADGKNMIHYQKWPTFPGPLQSTLQQTCNFNLLVFWNAACHSRLLITVMPLSCWLVASVSPRPPGSCRQLTSSPCKCFTSSTMTISAKYAKKDLNSQLSLLKEYKHFPLALTNLIKPAFHHLSEFLHQFRVLQCWIQLHYKQGLCTVMQLRTWHTCKGAWGPHKAELSGKPRGGAGPLSPRKLMASVLCTSHMDM